ncbi:MAG TPA: DUF1566 domain-containing protein [Candidatus Binatia bacterium]|nr:DUF1566 domain-containing protein [Candidatus Binatia bacterium]
MIGYVLRLGTVSLALSIAVGAADAGCPGDVDGNNMVTVDELVRAVNSALNGCDSTQTCGNGMIEAGVGEQCDGSELNGASCQTLGFTGGTLACSGGCQLDTHSCACGGIAAGLLSTGQTQCDQGSGTLGACPGAPAGQDGAVRSGAPLSYTDNSDGTIIDNVTGLQWEKLSRDGSVHDQDNTYTWYALFMGKLPLLNTPPCFAGHCDWRLPNRREVESLVDTGRYGPSIKPAFSDANCADKCKVTECSCTAFDGIFYWSSTTQQDLPTFAWAVDFNEGNVVSYEKGVVPLHVRAVRGGL